MSFLATQACTIPQVTFKVKDLLTSEGIGNDVVAALPICTSTAYECCETLHM